jgi:hypothetical protein
MRIKIVGAIVRHFFWHIAIKMQTNKGFFSLLLMLYWVFRQYPTHCSPFFYYSSDGLLPQFQFAMGHFDWHITQKKLKLGKLPLNSSLHVMIKCLSFGLTFLGEEGRTLGKGYGKKWVALGKALGEHMGTGWEHKKIQIFHPHN